MRSWFSLFASSAYAPHGYCLLWQPSLIWTHVVSDALIAAAYFSIPVALISLVRRRKDLEFGGMLWLFATFILACGTTHIMSIWNLWHGDYALEAAIKAITAAASVPTAMIIWPLIPRVLALPSPSQLQSKNEELAGLIGERDAALAKLNAEIAQREKAEEALTQRQKMEAVGQLTGGIAHDFNNLLQAVGGNLDLIRQRGDDPQKIARWTTNAIKGVDRGIRLTGQLLAFSRTQRLQLGPVDLTATLEEMADLIRRSIGPGIEFRLAPLDAVCIVEADATQLELAILNIVINARDAMPDGGRLELTVERSTARGGDLELEPGDYCEIAITDSGVGMDQAVMLRATEPFFTTKSVGQGSGLGLSMAFGMARQSGGTLRIRSAPGAGTTVTLVLKRLTQMERAEDAPGMHGEDDATVLPMARRPGTPVMLVDDDDDVREVITDTLETLGYSCESFSSGRAALEVLKTRRPAMLVLDFAMPEMNGAEVAQAARRLQPGIGIIFVSGYADSAALEAAMDARSIVLRKPFHAADLARLVDKRLDA